MTFAFSVVSILLLLIISLFKDITPKLQDNLIKDTFNKIPNPLDLPFSTNDNKSEMECRLNEIVDSVDQYFESTEIYLNSRLSADLLASMIKQNPRLIGASIRHKYHISFRDYINLRRIKYIEDTFVANKDFHKYSLDYIGEKAGFGTRQGFYSAFKKLKNTTPKAYFVRRSLR